MLNRKLTKLCQLPSLLQNLPANHPALQWTQGSISTLFLVQSRDYSKPISKFHYRSFHNIHHTLPSFRRPNGLATWEYIAVQDGSESDITKRNCDNAKLLAGQKKQKRGIYSQKQEQSQRPFLLSPQSLVAASPASVQPYLKLVRLDRPIGTWLLFLPCTFSISLAAAPGCLPDLYTLSLFGLGSILMRGAGCTINDMWDKDFDAKVERTKDRPLACGQLSQFQALTFLGLQLSGALAILLTFNWYTIGLGVSSLALCVTYPLMKRITYWPQAFLGLTLNYGVLISWASIHGSLTAPGVLLYTACALHTMFYDTVYSHQDKEDDILVGVKSTALRMGEQTKFWLSGFTGAIVSALATTGVMCDMTWPYYLGVAVFGGHLGRQIYTVDLSNPEDCGRKFRSNRNLGIAFWLFIMAANLMKNKTEEENKPLDE